MGEVGQRHAPAALPPAKKPGSHPRESCFGLGAGLDGSGKSDPSGFLSPDRLANNESIYNSTVPAVYNQLYLSIYSEGLYAKDDRFLNFNLWILSNQICEDCQIFLSLTSLRMSRNVPSKFYFCRSYTSLHLSIHAPVLNARAVQNSIAVLTSPCQQKNILI